MAPRVIPLARFRIQFVYLSHNSTLCSLAESHTRKLVHDQLAFSELRRTFILWKSTRWVQVLRGRFVLQFLPVMVEGPSFLKVIQH